MSPHNFKNSRSSSCLKSRQILIHQMTSQGQLPARDKNVVQPMLHASWLQIGAVDRNKHAPGAWPPAEIEHIALKCSGWHFLSLYLASKLLKELLLTIMLSKITCCYWFMMTCLGLGRVCQEGTLKLLVQKTKTTANVAHKLFIVQCVYLFIYKFFLELKSYF